MKVYTFTVELPSGRVIVLEGEAPEDLDAADRSFLAALEGRTFSARGVPGAASWRRADRARVHLEAKNAEPGRTPPGFEHTLDLKTGQVKTRETP